MSAEMLNLQIFANNNINKTDTGTLSAEMKTYYVKRLLDSAEPNLVHRQFGMMEPIPKGSGKTIEFRRFTSLPVPTAPLTEGVTPDGTSMTVTTVTGTVNQFGAYIMISDLLETTAIDRQIEQATKLLGSQAGRKLDQVTRDVIVAGTNVMYAPKIGADGATTEVKARGEIDKTCLLTRDVIFRAVAELASVNAPKINNAYIGIIHPYIAADLMRSEDWIDVHKYADPESIYMGEIGMLGGVRFVQTTEAKIFGGQGAATGTASNKYSVYATMIIGENAFGVSDLEGNGLQHIVKQLGAGDDPLNQRATTGWKATTTSVRLNEEYMIRIEHGSDTAPEADAN